MRRVPRLCTAARWPYVRHAPCNMQRATCNLQRATYNVKHGGEFLDCAPPPTGEEAHVTSVVVTPTFVCASRGADSVDATPKHGKCMQQVA